MIDFNTFTNIGQIMWAIMGKLIVATGYQNLPKVQ